MCCCDVVNPRDGHDITNRNPHATCERWQQHWGHAAVDRLVQQLSCRRDTLILAGAAVDKCTTSGRNPLWAASHNGHAYIVDALLAADVAVDTPNNYGETPIQAAWANGHMHIVAALEAAGGQLENGPVTLGVQPRCTFRGD